MKQIKVIFVFALILACSALLGGFNMRSVKASPSLLNFWNFSDNFSGPIFPPWTCWTSPDDAWHNCVTIHDTYQGSTNTYVELQAGSGSSPSNGFSTVGRQVTLTPFQSGRTLHCAASMKVLPYTGSYPFTGQLEVIDVNTWTYISIKPFSIYIPIGWNTVTTSSWIPPHKDVFVRMLFNSDYARQYSDKLLGTDDLIVNCAW